MLVATAVVPKADLVRFVESVTPLRIDIDAARGRSLTLGHAAVTLVSGAGLRLRGDARVTWDFAHVAIPVTVNAWQLMLVPRIAPQGHPHVLVFEPVLEDLDLKLVPGFVDEKVAGAIRAEVAKNRERLAWDFARTLTKRLPLPARVSPPSAFEIFPLGGEVSVSESELRLELHFEARFEKKAGATEATQLGVAGGPIAAIGARIL
jgi:hypothetical protein